jgi:hypothetical protein
MSARLMIVNGFKEMRVFPRHLPSFLITVQAIEGQSHKTFEQGSCAALP